MDCSISCYFIYFMILVQKMIFNDDLLRRLQALVGERPDPAIIEQLERSHRGAASVDLELAADDYRALRRMVEHSAISRIESPDLAPEMITVPSLANVMSLDPGEARSVVVSVLLAKNADKDRMVQGFRKKQLRGRLLKPDQVSSWIAARARREKWKPGPGTNEIRYLKYGSPGDRLEQMQAFADGGILEALWRVTWGLSKELPWTEAQSTLFVLTGRVPLVRLIRSKVTLARFAPVCSRITLEIDPAATPEQVRAAYIDCREQIIEGRSRRLSTKHLALAFFAGRADLEEASPAALMRQWNRRCPDFGYDHPGNFMRDCRAALQRTLSPNYDWAPSPNATA